MIAPRIAPLSRLAPIATRACFCLVILASPSAALADTAPGDKAAAEVLFREGKALMSKGSYADACPKLEQSHKLDPQPGTLLSLAMCHESEGRIAAAWAEYQEALAFAKKSRRQDRIQLASTRLKALEKVLPRIALEVDTSSMPEGLVITRDGVDIGRGAWGVAVPVDPGEYALTASAPGRVSWKVRVRIDLGETKHIPVPALEREVPRAAPEPAASAAVPADAPADVERSSRTTWGWVLGGAGLASLAVGGYFGLRALTKDAQSEDDCRGVECGRTGADLNRDARRSANVANVFVPLGLVGVGLGTWLIVSGGKSEPRRNAVRDTIHVSAGWVPGHTSMVVTCPW